MVWERQTETRKRMETATMTYSFFFSGPYHAVLSSRLHLVFCFSAGVGNPLWATLWDAAPAGCRVTRLRFGDWPLSSGHKLGLTQDWDSDCLYLTWAFEYIISVQLHVYFCLFSQERPVQIISDWQVKEVPVVSWLSSQDGDTATRVQILDLTDCISHSTNTLRKGMNPIILPPAMGK